MIELLLVFLILGLSTIMTFMVRKMKRDGIKSHIELEKSRIIISDAGDEMEHIYDYQKL